MPELLIHLVDEGTPEDGLRQCGLLLRQLPRQRVAQRLVVLGRLPESLPVPADVPVEHVSRLSGGLLRSLGPLREILRRHGPSWLHAWSPDAASAAGSVRPEGARVVTTLSDVVQTPGAGRWWPPMGGGLGRVDVICASETIRRQALRAGILPSATTVILPGVDFEALEEARKSVSRADFELPESGPVLLTASPPTRAGGQFQAAWAAAILHQVWPGMAMIVPGTGRERDRIQRLIDGIYCPEVYRLVDDTCSPAELLAVSDMLIFPAVDDVPAGWLHAAMAAAVPVVACGADSVREQVTDRENGFISPSSDAHTLAIAIRAAWESGQTLRQCVANARQQAEERCDVCRCVEDHLAVYAALRVPDPARVG